MPASDDLLAIIDRILTHQHTDDDLAILRQAISTSSSQDTLQIGKYNVNIGSGQDIHIGDKIYQGTDAEAIREIIQELVKSKAAVKYIPYPGTPHFVGRGKELTTIHDKLHQENNAVAISAVSGMGGIGKTELAVKYAKEHINDYPGGICWLNARDANLAGGIIQFVQLEMGLEVPQKDFQGNAWTLNQQVAWCWQNWQPPEGLVLLVFDDMTNLEGFDELIPPNHRFRVLITTRLRDIDANVEEIPLDVLSPESALQLLINIVGEKKVNKELETAKELCKWLGYLPLGIELVGRYIKKKPPHFTLAKMLKLLQQQRLKQEAINLQQKGLSTVQRGVLAAFELSWVELSPETQRIAGLLSLFAADIFVWEWVESTVKYFNQIKERKSRFKNILKFFMPWGKDINQFRAYTDFNIETALEQLYQRNLMQCLEENDEYGYKIHPLIREFLKVKLTADDDINEIKQAFTTTLIEIAETIPQTPTLELINSVRKAIPHLTKVAENLIDAVSDENLIWAFTGLAFFYNGQGLYALAEPWLEQCVSVVKSRLGENHPDYASSLNNLAFLYKSQGKYEQAESLYIQAKELYKSILGENYPDYASSLNNLAALYTSQGKYEPAEPLYIQAKELYKSIQGENHPLYAQSLNNLAALYYSQGKYEQAEHFCIQALELRKSILGENHPLYALNLNNLAVIYNSQGKYEQAEPLYIQALELIKSILGENHPDYATSLNNLAELYHSQGKYEQAELLYIQALELIKSILGENHPLYAQSLNNLAALYYSQGKYEQAEPLYIQALQLRKSILGENHPHYASNLNNLAFLYYSQGKYEQAEPLYIQALEIAERVLGANNPNTVIFRKNLENLRAQMREGGR